MLLFLLAGHDNSSFDVLISGTDQSPFAHTNDLLAEMLRILKPTGHLAIKESKGLLSLPFEFCFEEFF